MSPRDPNAAEVAELLPEIMRRLGGGRSVPAGMRELTLPQARALKTIAESAGCPMGLLAGRLHITMGAATGLVDRLIQQGLVEREADPRDRRVVRVRLTAAGRRAHLAAVRAVRRRLVGALERLSSEQREQVVRALTLLKEALAEGEG